MSEAGIARRVEIRADIDGADVSADINKYLISMGYTDNEADKADDLQIELDDREGAWIGGWLSGGGGAKGLMLHVVALQKNWESDGKDRALDCGSFEIDAIDASGPPARVALKATSLPYSSAARAQTKTRAWENIKLSAIAAEIAQNAGMKHMFESSHDPLYKRCEQVQQSDIAFLQKLCAGAGMSLKVTAMRIVLFDAEEYEQNEAVMEIARGAADVKSYRFSAQTGDVAYARCHVGYTDAKTGEKIEYTYTPRGADENGQTLEVNEKASSRDEAQRLAMKRLREKNKGEYTAEIALAGDVRLVAGATVAVSGYGMFDGKYIIETASHAFTGGYGVSLKLRRALEGY